MKNTIKNLSILFTAILFTTTFACCKKSFVPKNPYGSNTISCKINGETFETKGPNGGNNISCTDRVYISGGLNGQKILAVMCDGKYNNLYITIWQDWNIGTYEMGNGKGIGYFQIYKAMPSDNYECKNAPETGKLVITNVTSVFIAGTFEFTAKELGGKTITVTEGKFDIAR
jgi:hypothetical protein